ncbi:MAG: hypothetical protein WCL29_00205 [Pseudomonadota bacterium]
MKTVKPSALMNRQHQGGWLKSLGLSGLNLLGIGNLGSDQAFNLSEHYIHMDAGVRAPATRSRSLATTYWVLSRACYVVRIIDLKGVPASKRPTALALAQTAWTPFAETAHYVIPQQDSALLCAWNSAAITSAMSEVNVDAHNILVIPETALRFANAASDVANVFSDSSIVSLEQSVVVSEAIDGVVATVGTSNRITAEQWWPSAPTHTKWVNFQRCVGLPADIRTNEPALLSTGWRRTPVGYAGGTTRNTTSIREWWIVAVAAWILVIPTILVANEWRQLNTLKREAITKLVATERELDAALGARAQALAGLDRVTMLAALFGQPNSLMLFALVNDVLAQLVKADVLHLIDWDLRGQQLKFTIAAPNGGAPAATALIKAFEQTKILREVEVNVDGARTMLSMRIVSQSSAPATASTGNIITGNP